MSNKNEKIKRGKELKKLIKKYNKQYYANGTSEISDMEYDRLYKEYELLEEEFPELKTKDSPTLIVGAGNETNSNGLEKIEHISPLLSINQKSKSEDVLIKFYDKLKDIDNTVIVQPKYDGITINLNYKNGILINAATRGNGYIGELITDNILILDNIPKELKYPIDLEIRGEAIIEYNTFKEKLANEGYSNPRNAIAGLMTVLEPDRLKDKGIDIIFYDIGTADFTNLPRDIKENKEMFNGSFLEDIENLKLIEHLGFKTTPYFIANNCNEMTDITSSKFNNKINQIEGFNLLSYNSTDDNYLVMCDGIVIKTNDRKKREVIGWTQKGPKWAFAYKFESLKAETIIRDIKWQVGRTGIVTPVAIFDEVILGGTKITKATLNNLSYMQNLEVIESSFIDDMRHIYEGDVLIDTKLEKSQGEELCEEIKVDKIAKDYNGFWILEPKLFQGEYYNFEPHRFKRKKGLHKNDIIIIERSNDVIPRIIGIKKSSENMKNIDDLKNTINVSNFHQQDKCPICGSSLKESNNGISKLLYCQNPMCEAQIKNSINHFVERDAMNIMGFGDEIVSVLVNKGYIKNISDIYVLNKYKKELLQLDRFGEKKVNNLLESIEKSKEVDLWRFIYSLGIPNCGTHLSKDLANKYKTLENLINAITSMTELNKDNEDLKNMDGVAEITANAISEFFKTKHNIEIIKLLLSYGIKIKEVEEKTNLKFKDMTFVLTGSFTNPKKYYEEIIESKGGKIASSVSKKTSVVLIGESAGSKEKKARELVEKGNNILLLDNEEKIVNFIS